MITGEYEISTIGFLSKKRCRKYVMKDKILLHKLIRNDVYPMQPWFYSPFKSEKDGLLKYKTHWNFIQPSTSVATLLWENVRMKLTLPKVGTWESFGTLEISGQNISHWGVLYIIGKILKCRCRKWPFMGHLDIYSTSYGKKKGRESTRPQCVQVKCNTPLKNYQGELQVCFRPHPNRRSEQRVIIIQSLGSPNRGSFGTPPWESQDKKPFGCGCHGEAHSILYGGRWWFPLSPSCGESSESKVAHGLS